MHIEERTEQQGVDLHSIGCNKLFEDFSDLLDSLEGRRYGQLSKRLLGELVKKIVSQSELYGCVCNEDHEHVPIVRLAGPLEPRKLFLLFIFESLGNLISRGESKIL